MAFCDRQCGETAAATHAARRGIVQFRSKVFYVSYLVNLLFCLSNQGKLLIQIIPIIQYTIGRYNYLSIKCDLVERKQPLNKKSGYYNNVVNGMGVTITN